MKLPIIFLKIVYIIYIYIRYTLLSEKLPTNVVKYYTLKKLYYN